jgi:hypothetical protein
MEKFLERYHSKITGVLSTFDRMIFKGHILPFFQRRNRHYYLFQEKVSEVIKANARELSAKESRPLISMD